MDRADLWFCHDPETPGALSYLTSETEDFSEDALHRLSGQYAFFHAVFLLLPQTPPSSHVHEYFAPEDLDILDSCFMD